MPVPPPSELAPPDPRVSMGFPVPMKKEAGGRKPLPRSRGLQGPVWEPVSACGELPGLHVGSLEQWHFAGEPGAVSTESVSAKAIE